jgi:LuxR family quorum-sensing system transcriptional regulator CciR
METVAAFAMRLREVATVSEVDDILSEACGGLGFAYHALVHHGDLANPPARFLFLQNYPPAWVETYTRQHLYRDDPAQRLAGARPGSFVWEDLPRLASLSSRERGVLKACHDAGLGEGFTVPLHAYGMRAASCSFATEAGISLPREKLIAAEVLATAAFSALFDLFYPVAGRTPVMLAPRECECLVLAAQGKSDWEIGVITGLAEETVTGYLKAARRRFGVATRTQLVVAALAHGLIGWDETITWQNIP